MKQTPTEKRDTSICGVHKDIQDIIWSDNAFEGFFYMYMCMSTGNKGNKLWFEVGVEDRDGVAKDQDVS